MRSKVLMAATILLASAASVWSQEPPLLTSTLLQSSGESPAETADVPLDPPAAVGTIPWLDAPSNIGRGNRFWGSAEALQWWTQSGNVPPLATVGTVASGGAIGPGTTIRVGGNKIYNQRPGGRFTLGYWLNSDQSRGIEGSYFFTNGNTDAYNADSTNLPAGSVLARPFVNAITGLQDAQLISFPGISSGTLGITSGSQFQGAQLNMLCKLCCCTSCCDDSCVSDCCVESGYRIDMISGFRFLQLNENLVITEALTILPSAPSPPFVPGSMITVVDRFETRNSFYGGQIGIRAERYRGPWFANVLGTVAIGGTHQQVRIGGTTVFADPGGASVTQQGGLLAQPTNIGTYSRDVFTVVPGVNINAGRQVSHNMRVFVGYSLFYMSNVVRPGDQIDVVVNPTQLPTPTGPGTLVGPARPAFVFHGSDFWAQGINFGVQLGW